MEPAKSGSQSNKVLFVKKIDRPPPEEFETDNESLRVLGFGVYSAVGDMAGVGVAEREGVTLQELKKKMAELSRERDWDQFHSPRNLLLALVGEVGELSEIFQWKAEVPRGLPYWKEEEKQHLGEVLSDVLLYLVRLSEVCGIDLGKAAPRKLELNAIKYQVKLCKGSSKKYTQLNAEDNTTMCCSDHGVSGTKNSSCER
ncbi:hypothetical protein FF1_031751 [Malus domestica]|nr:dCTP pyrophosphatase 1-like [Malus domestica]